MTASHCRQKQFYFFWLLSYIVGHLIVFTTLVCVLFVATPMSTIGVYDFSMSPVCGHSDIYY